MAVAGPVRLVYLDDNGKFQLDPEALAVLQLVKEPVGIVSVCGRARQGKSFILNQLLGRSSGFEVAATHRPCTKGIWLWSAPLKITALDGTKHSILLLDTEGIDAYDQTGTYSKQIFSLAILLSSMFIYNQMGGIDGAALDRLSLVTEVMKNIHIHDSAGKTTASELGQFSPNFVWLLRDFYLDLVEDNRKITPRDYLELALRSVQDGAVSSKNEIRESIRALFPDRECFTLVRPLSNEYDLQHLDQISVENLRPEFKSGLDALTRYVFERTRPKHVGATVMTGPIFSRITQSFLDSLNMGAVPSISSSWQSVEEAECQRAFDVASEAYMSSFDHSKPPDEDALREAHEDAVQKAVAAFNSTAVGGGSIRQKYEKRLHTFIKKAFEVVSRSSSLLYSLIERSQTLDIKKDAYRDSFVNCSNSIQKMEREMRSACQAPDAKLYDVLKILDRLVAEYNSTCHGPEKLKKLTIFLQQSMDGPIYDLVKKQIDQLGSEKRSLALKCRRNEDKVNLLQRQLKTAERQKCKYQKLYEAAISDEDKLSDGYECSEWKWKYEELLSRQKAEKDGTSWEIQALKSKSQAAEAKLAAAHKQAQSAREEAQEWKRKYDIAVKEAKNALGHKAATNNQKQFGSQFTHLMDAWGPSA